MGKKIVLALIIGIVCWIVIALICMLRFNMTFVQGLLRPYSVFLAAASAVGTFIGYLRKK